MGQVQSEVASSGTENQFQREVDSPSDISNSQSPSLDSLIAEATAFGSDDPNQSLDAKAQKALECPCIAHLRSGPCGTQFSEAFVCFLKSTSEEKGSDCVHPFVALQNCIKANPDAFRKDIIGEDEVKDAEKPVKEYKIIPPQWSSTEQKRP